jgi:hypothetical protein
MDGGVIASPAQKYCERKETKMNDDRHDVPQRKTVGRPFESADHRINRGGRPKHFDQFRKLAQRISHEKVLGPNGNTITRAEQLLRRWAQSRVPALQLAFAAYCWGKPPEKIEATGLENKPVLRLYFAHEEPGFFEKHPDLRPTGRGRILPEDAPNGEGTLRLRLPNAD